MHDIEPYYNWRDYYIASEDEHSPFYGEKYDEFYFKNKVYNYYIHPQWDNMESTTLFLKVLYADYENGFCIIELIGEWNDCIYNDIMTFKRNILEEIMNQGIYKFILITENVLNFHHSDDLYYEEWYEEMRDEDGWAILLNSLPHVQQEMKQANLHYYLKFGGIYDTINWRALTPKHLFGKLTSILEDEPSLLNSYDE